MDDNVTVLPKLANRFAKQRKNTGFSTDDSNIDPDVNRVLNESNPNDLDVIGLQHEPTKEELQSDKNSKDSKDSKINEASSMWSWVIIVLAFIVVVLVIAIAWYILRENTENLKPQPLQPHIIEPQHPSYNYKGYQMPNNMHNQMHNQMPNNMHNHPINRPQMEQLPIQTKSMHNIQNKQPTKLELEETLRKLESIKENPNDTNDETNDPPIKKNILKPRNIKPINNTTLKTNKDNITEPDSSENAELDNKLSKKFYDNLQKSVDLDKADSDTEECRDEQD